MSITLTAPAPPSVVRAGPTVHLARPSYEGANIRTWIGFKHFMYLVEAAVLEHFSASGCGAWQLYADYGLGLEIVDCSVQLPTALEVDDQVRVTVTPANRQPADPRAACPTQGAAFTATITLDRGTGELTALKGKITVVLVREQSGTPIAQIPTELGSLVVGAVDDLGGPAIERRLLPAGAEVADVLAPVGGPAFLWSWRAPYFYCHFSDRLQHSGYVRTLEEVVDRFLYDRGLGIGTLLAERGWIPVVSRARVRMLADVHMEETVHTVFRVQDILKDISYTAQMDCWVQRGDELIRTATATIMHGYAVSRGPEAGTVAVLDPDTQRRLLGETSHPTSDSADPRSGSTAAATQEDLR